MEQKIAQFINKGMQQDYSISKASNEFAFKNHNIRITTRGENSLLTVTNEKSNKEILSLSGVVLGYCVTNNSIVLFCKREQDDVIYELTEQYNLSELYSGDLNFNLNNPIEAVYNYESEKVEKIYWVDGINTPRLINIKGMIQSDNNTQFDFNPAVSSNINVTIEKSYSGEGLFKPGVIQYILTYYNNYAQESAPIYVSPLYYLSNKDRGGSPDSTVSNLFTIICSDFDTNWDNIVLYSLHRTSENSTILGYKVKEYSLSKMSKDSTITFVDSGTNLESIDPTKFLFENDNFIPSTISKKSDKLFFADIKTEEAPIDTEEDLTFKLKNQWKLSFNHRSIPYSNEGGLYDYDSQLERGEHEIKTFKGGEKYRFALQFQDNRGIWSTPYYIGDIVNELYPKRNNGTIEVPYIYYNNSTADIKGKLGDIASNYVKCRLLMAEPTSADRSVVAQGILSPTVYNMNEAVNGTCHYANSWIQRFTSVDRHLQNVNKGAINKAVYAVGDVTKFEIPIEYNENGFLVTEDDVMSSTSTVTEENDVNATKANILSIKATLVEKVTPVIPSYDGLLLTYALKDFNIKVDLFSNSGALVGTKEININGIILGIEDEKILPIVGTITKKRIKNKIEDAYNSIKTLNTFTFNSNALLDDNTSLYDFIKNELGKDIEILNINKTEYVFTNFDTDSLDSLDEVSERMKKCWGVLSGDSYNTEFNISQNFTGTPPVEIQQAQTDSKNQYFVDANTISFYSPDLEDIDSTDLKFRIVGCAALRHNISDYHLEVDNADGSTLHLPLNFNKEAKYLRSHFLQYIKNFYNEEDATDPYYGTVLMSLWHKSGPLSNKQEENVLKRKVVGNLWYCDSNYYADNNETSILWEKDNKATIKLANSPTIALSSKIYKKDYESFLYPATKGFIHVIKKETTPYTSIKDLEKGYGGIANNPNTIVSDTLGNGCLIKYNSENHAVITLPDKLTLPGFNSDVLGVSGPIRISTGEEILTPQEERFLPFPIQKELQFFNLTPPETIDVNLGVDYGYSKIPDGGKCVVIFWTNDELLDFIQSHNYEERYQGITESIKNNFNNSNLLKTTSGVAPDLALAFIKELIIDNTDRLAIYKNNTGRDIVSGLYAETATLDLVSERMTNTDFLVECDNVSVYQINMGDTLTFTSLGLNNVAKANHCKAVIENDLPVFKYNSRDSIVDERSNIFKNYIEDRYWESNPCVWIGELYRDNKNAYGGDAESSIYSNTFIVCSEDTDFSLDEENIEIKGTLGDTYVQRWDCLRTYPTTEEDTNSIIDVVSTVLETHKNLDGRYDNTRGRTDITNIRPTNINLINDVYSQKNNFFSYSIIDNRTINKNIQNCYTWSLSKTNNELIDQWTKGLMVNINSIDGAKGAITKLQLWKDYLLVFQERGIARIHYNDQTTMGTLEGIPIEIANSQTVTGHTYLSEQTGCSNKWSIAVSEAGIYFVDDISKSINLFNGNIMNLTYNKAFKDWSKANLNGYVWNPNNTNAYFGTYDRLNHEYYITNDNNCLCFSEDLNSFVSFYDYTKSPMMISFKDKLIGVQNGTTTKLWEQFAGDDYCNFYGEQKCYSVEFNVNQDPLSDKTFNNVEYRANVKNLPNETFDNMIVSNEYQYGELLNINSISKYKYPNSEKKYRIWRLDIPRDKNSKHGLDRMRNLWMKLKLEKTNNTNELMEMHDLLVRYYV